MSKTTIPSLEEMADAGVHYGHRTRRWHPKMKKYIYGVREGVHIIDLEKTLEQINIAVEFIRKNVTQDTNALIIGTKRQASTVVKNLAQDAQVAYITERWPGGLITNFSSMKNPISKYQEYSEIVQDSKKLNALPSKEKYALIKEKERLEKLVGGLTGLSSPPSLIIVVDPRREKTAILEARKAGVPTIGIIDTNTDPSVVDIAIPANDDALKSIELILKTLSNVLKDQLKSLSSAS